MLDPELRPAERTFVYAPLTGRRNPRHFHLLLLLSPIPGLHMGGGLPAGQRPVSQRHQEHRRLPSLLQRGQPISVQH